MIEENHSESSTKDKNWGLHEIGEEPSSKGGSTEEEIHELETSEEEPQEKSIIDLEREYWEKKIKLIDIITEKVTGKKPEEKIEEES